MENNKKIINRKAYRLISLVAMMFIITLFSLNIVASAIDITTSTNYEKAKLGYPEITLNDWFGLPLIGEEIFKGTIEEHTQQCSSDCASTIKVLVKEGLPYYDSIRFERIMDDGTRKDVNIYSYKIEKKISQGITKVPIYEYTCSDTGKVSINGTAEKTCENKEIGTRDVEQFTYEEITPETKSDGKEIELRITGEKKSTWEIDWILKTNGEELSAWAVWGSGVLLSNLISYYKFDETSGTSALDSLKGKYNVTTINGHQSASGILGYAYKPDNEWTSTNINFSGNTSYSFNYWLNRTGSMATGYILAHGDGVGPTPASAGKGWVEGFASDVTYTLGTHDGTTFRTKGFVLPLSQWDMLTLVSNSTQVRVYQDAILQYEYNLTGWIPTSKLLGIFGGTTGNYKVTNIIIDEVGIWGNRVLTPTEITELYNSGSGLSYNVLGGGSVTLNSPANLNISVSRTNYFNITASPASPATLVNVSILTNETGIMKIVNTTTTQGALISYTFASNGNYLWTARACDSDGDCGMASSNYTITINKSKPTLSLISPINDYKTIQTSNVLSCNATSYGGATLSNISLWTNNTGWKINQTNLATTIFNSTTFSGSFPLGNYNWTCSACDSDGDCGMSSENRTIGIVPVTVNSANFSATALESSLQSFTINFTTQPSTVQTAIFNYNSVSYTTTLSCASNNCIGTNNINVPLIETNNIKFFNWTITSFDGSTSSSIISSTYNQTLLPFNLTLCSSGNISMNFTCYDEQNLSRFPEIQFDGSFNYWVGSGSIKKQSNITINASEIDLCFNQNSTYNVDAIIAYSPKVPTGYTVRNYFYQNKPFSQKQTKVELYSLLTSAGTGFTYNVKDQTSQPVGSILIETQKYYPGIDQTKTLFITRTNVLGNTYGDLEANIALYQFVITNNSETLLVVSPPSKVVPQTAPYTLLFQIGAGYTSPFINVNNVSDITSTLIFNTTSNLVVLSYVDTSGNLSAVNLKVVAQNISGNSYPVICDNFLYNLSIGTITCNVTGNGAYTATAYYYRSPARFFDSIVFAVQNFATALGGYGFLLGFFILIICAFAFTFNEIAGIWAMAIGVLGINMLGIINFGYVFVTATILIAIVITAILER